jgi:hypothetical protein
MTYLKMLGLAALGAMALTAVIGPGSASASVLCSTKSSPCTGTIYPNGQAIKMQLKTGTVATLDTAVTDITCSTASIQGKITVAGTPFANATGEITMYAFAGCQTTGGTACILSISTKAPYHFAVDYTSGGNGTFTLEAGAGGQDPGLSFVCGPEFNCKFTNLLMSHSLTGGEPATVVANKIPMARTGLSCPPLTPTWSAQYEVTEPNSLFVAAS